MEHLRCFRHHQHLDVFFGTQLQPAFYAGGRVFRALAVVAVRQDNGEAAPASPFGFAGGNELVDGDLRTVGEVAELGFPNHQVFRCGGGIAVFVGHHGFFVQDGIDYVEAALFFADVLQRDIHAAGAFGTVLVVQHGVAVREGAAARVFAGNADIVAGFEQAGIGDGFGHTPVNSLLANSHGFAVVDDFAHGVVQFHIGRDGGEAVGQAFDFGSRQSSFHRSAPADGLVFAPIHSVFAFLFRQDFLDAVAFIHRGAVVADKFFGFFLSHYALFNQLLGIHGTGAGVCGHLFVH